MNSLHAPTPDPPSRPLAERLVGRWTLVSFEAVSDGATEHPFGPDAVGELRYDESRRMAVQVMKQGRPRFASNEQRDGTVAEVADAFTGYGAYYGTYSVDEQAAVVTHHVAASLFPNRVGTDQRRDVRIEGDRLTLSTLPEISEGRERFFRLVWKRRD